MHYIITVHAQQRMVERRISELEVAITLRSYDLAVELLNYTTRLTKHFSRQLALLLWVVDYHPLSEPVIIKTVAWKENSDVRTSYRNRRHG
jgi:hypothetical protein